LRHKEREKNTGKINIRAAHLLSMPSQHPAVEKFVCYVIKRHRSSLLLQMLLARPNQSLKNDEIMTLPSERPPPAAHKPHLW
jgi:hypothetical protein